MKILTVSLAALAAAYAALVLPVLSQSKIVAKTMTREQISRHDAARRRVERALEAFRRGDPAAEAEAQAVMRALPDHDEHRLAFAAVLAARGQARAAYDLARPNAHFGELSLPDDRKMETYAQIAERAGHPEEAAWARERTGEDGHFRVWKRGAARMFPGSRAALSEVAGMYESEVNRTMDDGLRLHPAHRAEIEAMRRKLLDGGSPRP